MMKSRLPAGRSHQRLLPSGEPLYRYVSLYNLLQPCSTCKKQSFKCTCCIDTPIENPPLNPSARAPIENPPLKPSARANQQAAMCDPSGEVLRAFYGRFNQAFQRAVEKIAHLQAAAVPAAMYNEVLRLFYSRWFGEFNLVFQRAVKKIKRAVRVLIKRVST